MIDTTVTVRPEVLQSWLNISGYSKTQLAEELHISKGRISQLLHSDQEPSARLIANLLQVTELPFERLFAIMERRVLERRLQQAKIYSKRPPRAKSGR